MHIVYDGPECIISRECDTVMTLIGERREKKCTTIKHPEQCIGATNVAVISHCNRFFSNPFSLFFKMTF